MGSNFQIFENQANLMLFESNALICLGSYIRTMLTFRPAFLIGWSCFGLGLDQSAGGEDASGLEQNDAPVTGPEEHGVQLHYRISAKSRGHLSCEVELNAREQKRLASQDGASASSVFLICPQVSL